MGDVLREALEDHESVVAASRRILLEDLRQTADAAVDVVRAGGTVFAAGNGGSASDAMHFVAELVGRFESDRAPIRAVALGVDAPTTTAIANDFDFTTVVSRQLEALAAPGDLFLALSTSGRSSNIVRAAQTARGLGCTVAALTGKGGGDLAELCDLLVAIPATNTARIQEVHALCLHALAGVIESEVGAGES